MRPGSAPPPAGSRLYCGLISSIGRRFGRVALTWGLRPPAEGALQVSHRSPRLDAILPSLDPPVVELAPPAAARYVRVFPPEPPHPMAQA